MSVLDYLSDFICCLYGVPGAYGVVTMPFSVREGIIVFKSISIITQTSNFVHFCQDLVCVNSECKYVVFRRADAYVPSELRKVLLK